MGDLKNMSVTTDALILTPVRDQLKIRVTEHDKREYIYFLARFSFVFLLFFIVFFLKKHFFCFTELYSLLTYSYLNVTQIDFYSFVLFPFLHRALFDEGLLWSVMGILSFFGDVMLIGTYGNLVLIS